MAALAALAELAALAALAVGQAGTRTPEVAKTPVFFNLCFSTKSQRAKNNWGQEI